MPAITVSQAFDLALQYHKAGRLGEAEALYRQILAVQPQHSDATHLLGVVAHQSDRNDIAVELIRQAVALNPAHAEARNNLGVALKDLGRLGESIAEYRQAIALNPNYSEAYYNLGDALKQRGRLDEAIAAYRQAIALTPNDSESHLNLGNALMEQGRPDEAIASFARAIALQPNGPEAHHNLALALLVKGDFLRGWEEYEWRWKIKEAASRQRSFAQPQWEGEALEGRTLLVHTEQGFGDAIQFIRYLPLVTQCGGNIILECLPELQRLFQILAPNLPVLVKGQAPPAFDLHCPLLSLARVFSTDLGNIPQNVPYLHADAADAAIWRERLTGLGPSFKVGLVWAGRPTHGNDHNRSLKLASLAPLTEIRDLRFYSLQKGDAASEARTPPLGMELTDVAEQLKDFADTAALIANLDLVVTADTALAHLAGAMGRPVWTLLPFASDWRWLLDRSDSPWYPTMRLFRQPALGDWTSVIQGVAEELKQLASLCTVNSR